MVLFSSTCGAFNFFTLRSRREAAVPGNSSGERDHADCVLATCHGWGGGEREKKKKRKSASTCSCSLRECVRACVYWKSPLRGGGGALRLHSLEQPPVTFLHTRTRLLRSAAAFLRSGPEPLHPFIGYFISFSLHFNAWVNHSSGTTLG